MQQSANNSPLATNEITKKGVNGAPLLDKLSAELRNAIWELCFTSEFNANGQVELTKAAPPTKNLLLVSRKVNAEANGLFRAACRAYWRTTQFFFNMYRMSYSHMKEFSQVDRTGVNSMRNFTLVVEHQHRTHDHEPYLEPDRVILKMIDVRGGWARVGGDGGQATMKKKWFYYKVGGNPAFSRKDSREDVLAECAGALEHHDICGMIMDVEERQYLEDPLF